MSRLIIMGRGRGTLDVLQRQIWHERLMVNDRTEALETDKDGKIKEERARKYFDITWTPELAKVHRDTLFKYQPDLCSSSFLAIVVVSFSPYSSLPKCPY